MKTMHGMIAALVAALLAGGCGGEGAMALSPDAGGGTGGAAGMAAAETGGQAGGATTGTGGAPQAGGAIGTTFTRADHDMCMAWPVCPPGVVAIWAADAFPAWVRGTTCNKASDGRSMYCGACLTPGDQPACEAFVGRCIAPAVNRDGGTPVPADRTCSQLLASKPPVNAWILCTGFEFTSGSTTKNNAQLVCEG